MKKVKALLVPLIMLGLLTIIVLNIKRETNVEGNTTMVEPGKAYVEVILWTDGRETEFIKKEWLDFYKDNINIPQTIIIRKDCKEMRDFFNTIPEMKTVIDLNDATNPGSVDKDLKAMCPCVMLLFHDKSNNVIKRQLRTILHGSNLTKNSLVSAFETLYNTPYEGKTVSTI